MKIHLHKFLFPVVTALACFGVITHTSCNRNLCNTVVCANGGVCSQGACTCPAGYEGANCEIESRKKFEGSWAVFEKGSITPSNQYQLGIIPANNITDLQIRNFYNYFESPINAYVTGDSIYIPNQQYEGKVLFGKGYIETNATYGQYGTIIMRYEIVDTATQVVNDFGYYPPDLSAPSTWNK